MNKKANALLLGLIAVVAVIAGIGIVKLAFFPQTATDIQEQAQEAKTGEIATLKAYAVEKTNDDPNTQKATTAYFWSNGDKSALIGGTSGTTLSATATTAIKPVNMGDKITGIAFDSYNYGEETTVTIDKEGVEIKLPVYNISTGMTFRVEENGAEESSPSIDVSGGETDSFNKMVFEQSTGNQQARVKMICFQSNVSQDTSNITSIEVNGMTQIAVPIGKKGQHFCSEFAEAVVLNEFEEAETGAVKITGNSNGCASTEEAITVTYIDEQAFVALDGTIKYGVEKDDVAHTNVGWTDSSFTDSFVCS